jgi:hypothetical protein
MFTPRWVNFVGETIALIVRACHRANDQRAIDELEVTIFGLDGGIRRLIPLPTSKERRRSDTNLPDRRHQDGVGEPGRGRERGVPGRPPLERAARHLTRTTRVRSIDIVPASP